MSQIWVNVSERNTPQSVYSFLFILLAMAGGASTGRCHKNLHLCHLAPDPVAFGTRSDFRLHPSLLNVNVIIFKTVLFSRNLS